MRVQDINLDGEYSEVRIAIFSVTAQLPCWMASGRRGRSSRQRWSRAPGIGGRAVDGSCGLPPREWPTSCWQRLCEALETGGRQPRRRSPARAGNCTSCDASHRGPPTATNRDRTACPGSRRNSHSSHGCSERRPSSTMCADSPAQRSMYTASCSCAFCGQAIRDGLARARLALDAYLQIRAVRRLATCTTQSTDPCGRGLWPRAVGRHAAPTAASPRRARGNSLGTRPAVRSSPSCRRLGHISAESSNWVCPASTRCGVRTEQWLPLSRGFFASGLGAARKRRGA